MNKFIYLGSEWAESHEKLYLLGDSILFLLFLLGVLYLFIFAFFSLKKTKRHIPESPEKISFRRVVSGLRRRRGNPSFRRGFPPARIPKG